MNEYENWEKEKISVYFGTALKSAVWMKGVQLDGFLQRLDMETDFSPDEVRVMAQRFLDKLDVAIKEDDQGVSHKRILNELADQFMMPQGFDFESALIRLKENNADSE